MSSKSYPKTMQLSFTSGQHEKLKRAAYDGGITMNECVRRLVDGVDGVMAVVSDKVAPKPVSAPRQAIVKPDPNCKHSYVTKPEGGMICVKCRFEP